jgi:predicted dienelactone hydrolase
MTSARTRLSSPPSPLSFLLLVAAAAVGCEATEPPSPPPKPPVEVGPSGLFAIGTSAFDLTDPSRPEPHTEATDDHRRFVVRTWYPAALSDGGRAPYFLDPDEGVANAALLGLPADAFKGIATHAAVDAPVMPGATRFPIVLFSPARNIPVSFYTYELEDLASRGYAVFALSHPYGAYGTGVIRFADGSVADLFGQVFPDETRDQAVGTWSADQRFAIDAITALNAPGSTHRLAGRIDLDRIGVFGHSVGGAAASQTCLQDPRVVACANLDGSVGSVVSGGPPIMRPFLLMRAESTVESTLDPFFASLGGVAYEMNVHGAGHDSFSDMVSLLVFLQEKHVSVDTSSLALGTLTPLRRFLIVSANLAAFFDAHLQGQTSPLLESNQRFPEIVLARRN